jgi:hypothetical protein
LNQEPLWLKWKKTTGQTSPREEAFNYRTTRIGGQDIQSEKKGERVTITRRATGKGMASNRMYEHTANPLGEYAWSMF